VKNQLHGYRSDFEGKIVEMLGVPFTIYHAEEKQELRSSK
jgi:hypothetical protein